MTTSVSNQLVLTLSVGGVDFALSPDEKDTGKVELSKRGDEILLTLTSFSGVLRVAPSSIHASSEATTTLATDKPFTKVSEVTPKVSNAAAAAKSGDKDAAKRTFSESDLEKRTDSPTKRTRSTAADNYTQEDPFGDLPDYSQPTLLGQPDLSLTQSPPSKSQSTDDMEMENMEAIQNAKSPSKIQKILDSAASQSSAEKDYEPNSLTQDSFAGMDHQGMSAVANRVSIGGSPMVPKSQDPPCPRWGHTMTSIGPDRFLVYGGQAYDPESGCAKTFSDVYIFDLSKKQWVRPLNCDGMPRQWHTASFLPERNLLISFGGESINPKTGRTKTTEMVMVLDTEIMLWYPPSVSGEIPSGRSGHTATVMSKSNELIVFGGVKGSKWLNSVSVLNITRWKWSSPKIIGPAPKPRSYHSATALGDGTRIVVFGGNDATSSFNSVHVLDTGDDQWKWSNPSVKGSPPSPRTGHSATLMGDGKTICIYGGWDPNAEDDGEGEDDSNMFSKDYSFFLDTKSWTWNKGPKLVAADLPLNVGGVGGGEKRAGHEAVRLESQDEVLVFGGRVPGDRFVNDFQAISPMK